MFLNLFTRNEGAVYVLNVVHTEEAARNDAREWLDGLVTHDADVRVMTIPLVAYDHAQDGTRWMDTQSDPAGDERKAQAIRDLGAANFDQGFPSTACKFSAPDAREEWLRGWFAAERRAK